MSLSSSSSSSNLQAIKDSYIKCLQDIAEVLAGMDEVVESMELGLSADPPSSVNTLLESLKELDDLVWQVDACVNTDHRDYEDPPEYEEDEEVDIKNPLL